MNKTRFLCTLLIFSFLLGALASCSETDDIVMQMGEVSVDGIDYSADGKGFVADSDYISDDLFKYIYLFLKESNLANYQQYAAYGYDLTGDEDIAIGDTEAFWNCVSAFSSTKMTYGEELYEATVSIFESVLALEAIAETYGYTLPENYYTDRDKYIAEYITATGIEYLKDATEITDEDGNLLGWVKDRWAMQLMSEGASAEDWERVFYLYNQTLSSTLSTQLEDKGVIKAEADDVLIEAAREDYLKNNLKVKYIAYFLKVESEDATDSKSVSSEEVSEAESSEVTSLEESSVDETSSEESSEDTSSDESSEDTKEELTGKEYNAQLKEKCQKIYEGLLDGSLNVDDEVKKCDIAEKVADYPNGLVGSFSEMEKSFGESVKDLKVGDVKMYNYNGAIHIIVVQELTESDFDESLTDDALETLRTQSLSEEFKKLFDEYKVGITANEELLAKYKEPWKIH